MLVAQALQVDYCSLFKVQDKTKMKKMVDECKALETKLTTKKEKFYIQLSERVNELYD